MIRYLLDTNIISEPAKQCPDPAVILQLDKHADEIAIAAPVLHELRYGVDRMAPGARRDRIEDYVRRVVERKLPVMPYDSAAAVVHARHRAALESQGFKPGFTDSQIAAIALAQTLILVTRNVADFERFQGLEVENWFSA